ncbi:MAG: HNH endonuclease [Alphaproteobacteria bacterium]
MPRLNEQNKLALIVAYYLSRFNETAYQDLNFGSMRDTHKAIGDILNVKQNTVKNMRDEFDPLHNNNRKGWHQRELTGSRIATAKKYAPYSKEELSCLVKDILFPNNRTMKVFDDIDREELLYSDQQILEGEIIEKKIMLYKRNQSVTQRCKKRDLYTCQGCSFHYNNSIVECHHLKPLSMTQETTTNINDLITLCPNCHRISHLLIREDYEKYTQKNFLLKRLKEQNA